MISATAATPPYPSVAEALPPKFSVDDMNLTADEVSTYPRWYTDLLLRKRAQTLTLRDVLAYVSNFGLKQDQKSNVCFFFYYLTFAPYIFFSNSEILLISI